MVFFTYLSAWHWLILSIILFAIEVMGFGGFLLGVAVASFVTSILAWLNIGWQAQLVSFGVMSILFSVAYWKYFKNFNLKRQNDSVVNQKLETLVGKSGIVFESHSELTGKVKLGDTLWECRAKDRIDEGDKVIIEGYEGMVLLVKT